MKNKTINTRIHVDLDDFMTKKHIETGIPKTVISKQIADSMKSNNSNEYQRIFPRTTDFLGMKKKRGSMFDVAFIMISLFVGALFLLFILYMTTNLFGAMTPAFENITVGSSAPLTTLTTTFNNSMNFMYLALFFGLLMGLMITAYLTPTHPIFFPVAIIMLIGLVVVGALISNTYNTIASTQVLASTSSTLNIIGYIMGNLPIIVTVIGIIAMIILFSRSSFGGGFAQTQ